VLENNRKCNFDFSHAVWKKISDECKDLIRHMIDEHPSSRYKTKDVLRSEFITKYFPYELNDDGLSMRSVKSTRSIRAQKKRKRENSKGEVLSQIY
jgi:serine/threonine protein kinase